MSKDTRSPNVAAIRQLLLAAFTPEDLRRFCEDRDPFKSLLDRFASPNRLDQMVDEVVTYCEKQNLFDELLAQVEGANPRQYAAQARKLGLPQAGAGLDLACPYRGLEPFQAEHAEFFFGREAMVDALVAKVAETRFVAVVGPSGSGKSSLVRAGLVPALQDGALPGSHQWGLEIFRPGADPLHSLAGAFVGRLYPGLDRIERMAKARKLANYMQRGDLPLDDILKEVREDLPPRARLLLIADQFEETFTACGDEELRRSFVETLLAAAAGSWLSVLLTLRADFFGHVLKEPGLDRFVDAGQFNVLTMTRQELRTAIEGPADAVGCRFEPGLVERILDDVAAAPGRLPLLQFALTLLWQRGAARGVLTHAAYEAIGEVPGAIAQHADGVLGELSSADQERVREILTRLVRLARPEEGAEDTRLRVERSELDEEIQPLVDRLANARLIVTGREPVTGEPTVELAHEALIRHWQRLRDWLDDDRKNLQIRQGVRQATREWLRNAGDGGYLVHRARRLDEAIALSEQPGASLNDRELAYLEACTRMQSREAEEQLKDISEMGWGVIFAEDADPALRDALGELLEHRRAQATQKHKNLYREFAGDRGYHAGEGMWQFLGRQGVEFGAPGRGSFPYYLLLVGDPEAIPFTFQYQLALRYAVGRVHFDTLEEYAHYARSVVAAEGEPRRLERRLVAFAPCHPDDTATEMNVNQFVSPLLESLAPDHPAWSLQPMIREQATKARLSALLNGESPPALLFTVGHGLGFSLDDARQFSHQGALLCQDWPGPMNWRKRIPDEFIFAAQDVTDQAQLLGLVAFLIGTYTAGTPRHDDFQSKFELNAEIPRLIAPRPFIARLPQRLLGHPAGGALAVVGHIERSWNSLGDIVDAKDADEIGVFSRTLHRLLGGFPIGAAMEPLWQRYREYATEMTSVFEAAVGDDDFRRSVELSRRVVAFRDARNYVILGDPAVRLMVEPAPEATDTGALAGSSASRLEADSGSQVQAMQVMDHPVAASGWGVVFAHDAEPALSEALRPLLLHRQQQASGLDEDRYQEYVGERGYRPGESVEAFLARQQEGLDSTRQGRVPQFLLIAGEPQAIPFSFQYELAQQYAVGRVHFGDLNAYQQYAHSVVRAETEGADRPREVVFFGPRHRDDPATELSARKILPVLAKAVAEDRAGWHSRAIIGEGATKEQLGRVLGGRETPALLFAACHSVGTGDQSARTGALICQDMPWSERKNPSPEHIFFGSDLEEDANLSGLIAFLFTAYGAGTEACVAHLPQRLLSHPNGGALAVIGSVVQLRVSAGVNPFLSTQVSLPELALNSYRDFLSQLLAGMPVGMAMASFRRDLLATSPWVLIGDPAVRLAVREDG